MGSFANIVCTERRGSGKAHPQNSELALSRWTGKFSVIKQSESKKHRIMVKKPHGLDF